MADFIKSVKKRFSKQNKMIKRANVCENNGNHEEAFRIRKECYEYCLEKLGEDDPDTLHSRKEESGYPEERQDLKRNDKTAVYQKMIDKAVI